MRTREDLERFIADEARGFILRSFELPMRNPEIPNAKLGELIVKSMMDMKKMLDRIHAFYSEPEAGELSKNGQTNEKHPKPESGSVPPDNRRNAQPQRGRQ